jgi:hypothetical protein
MSQELANSPLFYTLASHGAKLYASHRVFLDKDALVIFTCGAASSEHKSARDHLLEYAKRYFDHGTLFRAEDAFPVLLKSSSHDLLTIEHRLADYSDCVLLINESAGTLAELGAFASNTKIIKKLLVVNPKEHIGRQSFINLGPIAKVDRKSLFKKTIHLDLQSASIHFDVILDRIQKHVVRKRRLSVDFSKADAWKTTEGKLRLLLLQDILNLFCPLTRNELLTVMKRLFPDQYIKFNVELGLLIATDKVAEKNGVFVSTKSCANRSYDVNNRDWLGLRKKIIDLYRSKDNVRLNYLYMRSSESL